MAIKKSDFDSSLYQLCDKLRGGMEPIEYKDYVLTLVFVKYITDKFKGAKYAPITIPEGCSFDDFKALRNSSNIGEEIDKALARLAAANPMLNGMFKDVHFNDETKIGKGKEMVDKLTDLINIFCRPEFDFSRNKASGDDILGDVYENLMKRFAVVSGKSKGQFYTPAEASRVIAGLLGIANIRPKEDETDSWSICDGACGSGSLLIRAANEAGCEVAIYGQELHPTTAALCKMNMVLHGHETAEIMVGNTFSDPQFKHVEDGVEVLDRFDFVAMNPPFSLKNWTDGYRDFGRKDGFGVSPPEKNDDYAWVLHALKSLKPNGRAAVILPLGVLFRGNAEGVLRKAIVDRGWLEGIVAFPPNIFFGTPISACVLVFDKAMAANRDGVFMVNASRDFVKDGKMNRLRERDIEKIVSTYCARREEPHYSRFVPWAEIIEKNGYNLNIPRYVDSGVREDLQDIFAHLHGGIPTADIDALGAFWTAFPALRGKLFKPLRDGYETLRVPADAVRETIRGDEAFVRQRERVGAAFEDWAGRFGAACGAISPETDPKAFVKEWARALFARFSDLEGRLLDPYDVYEVFLRYWTDTMADDVGQISEDGFAAAREIETFYKETVNKKTGAVKKVETGWEGRIVPRALLAARFFPAEDKAARDAATALEEAAATLDEYAESVGEDDDEAEVAARTKALEKAKKAAARAAKAAAEKLEALERAKYPALADGDLRRLVVDDKWLAALKSGIDDLHATVSNRLAERVGVLAARYAESLPELDAEGAALEKSVAATLAKMGY